MINQLLWSPTPVSGTKNRMQRAMGDAVDLGHAHGGLRKGPRRPGWDGGLSAFMRAVIASERGGALYKLRAKLVEPVFGDTRLKRHIGSTAETEPPAGPNGA